MKTVVEVGRYIYIYVYLATLRMMCVWLCIMLIGVLWTRTVQPCEAVSPTLTYSRSAFLIVSTMVTGKNLNSQMRTRVCQPNLCTRLPNAMVALLGIINIGTLE